MQLALPSSKDPSKCPCKTSMAQPGKSVDMTTVQQWSDGSVQPMLDYLVAEEPLEIRVNGAALSVTMRTPGSDLELAAGFLQTEGIIRDRSQIEGIAHGPREKQAKNNVVEVKLAAETEFDAENLRRNFFAASSCGICGKASIEMVRRRGLVQPDRAFRIDPEVMCRLPDTLRSEQAGFCTGSESFWPAFRRISSGGCISATGSSEASDWDSAISFQLRCW